MINTAIDTAKTATNNVNIGDVFVSSYGYDQTNNSYFQVTGLTPKGVKVREIAGNEVDKGMLTGETTPVKDAFTGEEKYHLLRDSGGTPAFRVNSFSSAFKTEWGKAHYCSHTH